MPKIGVILAVDGEDKFRAAMTNAKSAAGAVKAEMQALQQKYSENANSLQALTEKQNLLETAQDKMRAATNAARQGLENAQKAVDKHTAGVEKQRLKVAEAAEELRKTQNAYGESSDAAQREQESLDKMNEELSEQERYLQAAETGLNQWKKKVADCEKAEDKNAKALKENEKYLNEAKNAADGCATSIDKYGKKTKSTTEIVADFNAEISDGIKMGIGNMIANAGADAANMLKDAAKAAIEVGSNFEAAMSKVSALSGATGSTLEQMEQKAKQLGASTRFSATEVAEGFQYMALAGWDANTSLSAIDGVLQLAASAEMDLGQASDMVTDYLAAFGMEASKAGEMADMLAFAQANSNTTAAQLGEAYGNCAAGLHAAGQEMNTVTAILEGMANNGLKGSEAGTALNAVMAQITQKMKDGAIQIGDTSIAVQDEYGNFRDLLEILSDVEGATDGMGSAQRSAALAAVFNRTSLVGVNQILNEGVDNIKVYREELDKSAGAASDMADVMQDNLQGDITEMNSALEGLGISAFETFGESFRKGVQLATDVVGGLTSALDFLNDTFGTVNTPLDDFIANIEKGNENVSNLLISAQESFGNAEADAAKLEIYRQALLDVADATETTEFQKFQISQIVSELGDQIPDLAKAWDEETGKLNMNAEAIEAMMDAYEGASLQKAYVDALTQAQDALNEAIIQQAMADSAVETAQKNLNDARENGADAADYLVRSNHDMTVESGALVDTLNNAIDAQSEATLQMEDAQEQYDLTKAAMEKINKEHPEMAANMEETADAEEDAADATEELAAALDEIDEETLKALRDEAIKMRDGIQDAMEGVVSAFDEFNGGAEVSTDEIIKNLDSQIEGLEGWSSNMQRLAQEAGSGMSQELYDYLAEMGPQSANLVQTLVDALENDTGSFEEISQKWGEALKLSENADAIADATTSGKALAEAYGGGITEGIPTAQEAMQTMGQTAVEILDTTKTPMTAKGLEGVMAFAQGETAGTGSATSAASAVASAAASSASNSSGFYSAGAQSASGLASGIRSGRSGAVSAAVDIMRAAVAAAKKEADIHSPSKKWKKEIGEMLTKGMAQGITSGETYVTASVSKMSRKVYNNAEKYLKKHTKTSKAGQKYLWQQVVKETNEGTKAYIDALKKLDKLEDKELEKRIKKDFGVSRTKTTGSGKKKKTVKKSAKEYSADVLDAAKTYIENFSAINDVSEKQELKYWKNVKKRLKKGSQAWYDAQKEINKLQKSIADDAAKKEEEKRKTLASVQDSILDNYKVYYKVSAKAEMQYWDTARKQFKAGTQERIDADKKYNDAREDYLDKLNDLNEDYAEKKAEIDKDLKEQRDELTKNEKEKIKELKDAYTDAIASRKKEILDSMNLFDAWDSTGYTADKLLYNLKTQTEGLKLWEKEMNALRKKALPKEFVDQLEEMGPDATASIYSLNRMTSKQLDEYVRMWKEKNTIAQRQAEAENTNLLKERDAAIKKVQDDTAKQIAAITKTSNNELAKLQSDYKKQYAELNTDMSDALKTMIGNAKKTGEDAVAGLIAGLEAKEKKAKKKGKDVGKAVGIGVAAGLESSLKDAQAKATDLINEINTAMKKAAKIKSPSRLFRDEVGEQIAAGVAVGMDAGSTEVEGSAANMIKAALDAAETAQEPFDWEMQGIAGIRSLNMLTAPQEAAGPSSQVPDITGLLNTLITLVGAISEKDMNITLDSGELVGALTPGISREMAATSIRNTRGRLA